MAKKSASAKGYRTYPKKKAYMTKKEWTLVVIVLILLTAGIIVAVTVNFDGALTERDGVLQTHGERALLARGGTSGHPRYYQVGNMLELPEGWTLREISEGYDYSESYTVIPDSEAADSIDYIAVNQTNDVYAQTMRLYYSALSEDTRESTIGEIYELNDTAEAFLYDYQYEVTTEESETQTAYARMLNAYYELPDSRALMISVKKEAESAEELPCQEDMQTLLEEAYSYIQLQ